MLNKQKTYWSDYANDYFKTLYKDVKEYPALIIRHKYILDLMDADVNSIIDIGCGPGEMVRDLLRRGKRVYGVDIAEGMLKIARMKTIEETSTSPPLFVCGSIEALPIKEGRFDGVISAGVIEYLDTDKNAIREINRILKMNGVLVLTVRNKACPFRIFDILFDKLKQTRIGVNFLSKLKHNSCKSVRYIPYRKHFPWSIDRTLEKYGFVKEDFRYFHFYPFFAPFSYFFPGLFTRLGLRMERFAKTRLGILGSGYIVKAKKVVELY